jgi:hypothetical protein
MEIQVEKIVRKPVKIFTRILPKLHIYSPIPLLTQQHHNIQFRVHIPYHNTTKRTIYQSNQYFIHNTVYFARYTNGDWFSRYIHTAGCFIERRMCFEPAVYTFLEDMSLCTWNAYSYWCH